MKVAHTKSLTEADSPHGPWMPKVQALCLIKSCCMQYDERHSMCQKLVSYPFKLDTCRSKLVDSGIDSTKSSELDQHLKQFDSLV